MKKIVLLMFLIINLAGCSGIPTNANPPIYKQPQGKITLGNQDYPMVIGKFEWIEGKSEMRTLGNPDIYELADTFDTLEGEKGNKLQIEIEQNPISLIIKQVNAEGTVNEIQIEDNEITLPTDEGYYIYEVIATWNEGEISYIFDIDIK